MGSFDDIHNVDHLRWGDSDDNVDSPMPSDLDSRLLRLLRSMPTQLLHDADTAAAAAGHVHRHHDRHILHYHDSLSGSDHHE